MSTSVAHCLPFCVKLVLCYYCLLSLWRNKYNDDDDNDCWIICVSIVSMCALRLILGQTGGFNGVLYNCDRGGI